MTDVINLTKKAFTWSVVVMTIAWSVGLSALAAPLAANAAECPSLEAGDLFKVKGNSAVYLLNSDMKRMYFPTADVYNTWFSDFSGVVEIDQTCVSAYPNATNPSGVDYRPGSRLVKVVISPEVYAVGPGNMRHLIGSEEEAKSLYGDNWASLIRDIHDFHWPNYTTGAEVNGLMNGMLVKRADSDTVLYIMDGKTHPVDGTLPSFVAGDVRTVSDSLVDALEMSADSVTAASLTADPSQGSGSGTPAETPVGGDLTVSLSANTPEAGNVVINVDNVVFSKFVFKAGADKDVIVNAVRIDRKGLGATGDFTSVTLYDGSTKLGSTKSSWHSDGYMDYNVSGGWKIPAGSSKELTVVAKLDTAGTYNKLGVSKVTTNGGSVSGLPVYGNEKTGVDVTVGTVTITGQGVTTQNKNVGTNEVTLAQFKLAVNSVEDGQLRSITLKNKATSSNASDEDVKNLYLYKGTTKLAGPVQMKNDKITFTLDEAYAIQKSKNETFKVVGDIVSGVGNHVDYALDATTDLDFTGKTYGTNLTVTNTLAVSDSGTTDTTIGGAELNLSISGTAVDTLDDKEDVNFGTLTMSVGSTDVKITDMNLVIAETAASGEASVYDVDNFEMIDQDSGAAYSGSLDTAGDGNANDETWSFTDELYLEAGKTYKFTLQGDIPANVSSTASYKVNTTVNTTNFTAETVPDGDAVSNFSVGSLVGKLITVKAPTLTVKGISLTNANAVVNDTDVILFKGTMEASADNIHVEQVHFEENGTVLAIDNWSQLGFYTVNSDGTYTEQDLLTNSQMTSGSLDFDSLDFNVENGKKVTFVVKGSVASTLTADNTLLVDLNYVNAKDTDNNTATVTNATGSSLTTDGSNTVAGTRTLTMYSKGILYFSMLNTDTGFNKDRIALAGSDFWAGKMTVKADFEDILLEDLIVTSTVASAYDSVEELCIYSAQTATAENQIGCTQLDSRGVATFNDINKTVTKGTHTWYLYVRTNMRGTGASDTADSEDTLAFYITTTSASNVVARGVASGDTFSFGDLDGTPEAGEIVFDKDLDNNYDDAADYQTANTKNFIIAANRISNVAFVSSYGGEVVNSSLSGTGEYTAAIVAITTEANSNTDSNGNPLKVGIANLRFDIDKFASTTFSQATIERIGGTQGSAVMTTSTGDNLLSTNTSTSGYYTVAASSSLGVDSYIDAGDTAYFVVKINVNALNNVDNIKDWFRVDMDDLTGTYSSGVLGDDTNNNIDWYDDAITASSNVMFNALFLDTTKLTGTKISE